ncbi:Gamma-glutamylputrescine synthetase PuuA [bacterium HR40]|nr:Gamma-glutamylputrescine synthetase PuuA [bacterium HR40]
MAEKDALARFFEENPLVEQIEILIPDLSGIPRGKRISPEVLRGEALPSFPSSIYALDSSGNNVDRAPLVWAEGDADRPVRLDLDTLAALPWKPSHAQVIGGLLDHDGRPFYADARAALRALEERFAERGLGVRAAFEIEFYLLDPENDAEGRPLLPPSRRLARRPRAIELYSHERLDEEETFFEQALRWAETLGLAVVAVESEFAPGQFEINIRPSDGAVRAADQALLLERCVRAAASASGRRATFMAKPFEGRSGNGMHVHVSLYDADGRNLFGERPDGEAMLRRAVAGVLRSMPEAMAIFAPNANSYRRFVPGSYAPHAPCWGWNNRTVAVRIPLARPNAMRIEHRVAGADANPYLVLAAILAGILDGLEQGGDPGPPVEGSAYDKLDPALPRSWESALAAFRSGTILRRFLDPRLLDLYALVRDTERERFESRVTPLEYEWYLATV